MPIEWGSVLGAGVSGLLGFMGQEEANTANAQQAAQNREFQERMSNTSYQRAVEDMKAAGLNPMLAYSQGGARGTPGAQAVMGSSLGAAVNTGQTGAMLAASIDKVRADTDLSKSQAAVNTSQLPKIAQETETSAATAAQITQQTGLIKWQAEKLVAEIRHIAVTNVLGEWQIKKLMEDLPNIVKEGKRIDAHTGNLKADTALRNLEIPRATNVAEAQKSWWMKEISPYMPDVGRGVGGAFQLRRMIR